MATKDVPTSMVLQAVTDYKALETMQQVNEHVVQILMDRSGQCEKVCYSALYRDCTKGLIDYGVSIRRCWLTEKGKNLHGQLASKYTEQQDQ